MNFKVDEADSVTIYSFKEDVINESTISKKDLEKIIPKRYYFRSEDAKVIPEVDSNVGLLLTDIKRSEQETR